MVAGFLFKEYEMNQEGVVTGYKVLLKNTLIYLFGSVVS